MRTTLDLPETLLAEAMAVSKEPTKTAVIVAALEGLIQKNRIEGIKKYKGKLDLDIKLDDLRQRG
jgi:hypothetical protein|tara:strand:- start:97 stop:291 length:195 start_codon:yes stop_codon:yes gene_type:complete